MVANQTIRNAVNWKKGGWKWERIVAVNEMEPEIENEKEL